MCVCVCVFVCMCVCPSTHVPVGADPEFQDINDISEVSQHRMNEIKNFFEDYKKAEGKEVRVDEMKGAVEAKEVIQASMELYGKFILETLHS